MHITHVLKYIDGQSDKKGNSLRPTFNYNPSDFEPLKPHSKRSLEIFGKAKTKTGLGTTVAFLKGAFVRQAKTDNLDDIIIAVVGPTGSGKSTFIDIITELGVSVGDKLESCTGAVSSYRISMPELANGDLVFVDTPGFDNTHKPDSTVLKKLADWLTSTYGKDVKLSGLLYCYRISDNQKLPARGTLLKNLRMFEELCGKNTFYNVILATTMWDEVDEETGVAREQELKTKYWGDMLERDSTTNRFLRTRESAFTLIDPLIDKANERNSVLLQQEMVEMRKKLPATSAAQDLFSNMELLVRQREALLHRIRNEMKKRTDASGDKVSLKPLEEEYDKLKIDLESTVNEMRRLKLPLGKRVVKMTENFGGKFAFRFKVFQVHDIQAPQGSN